MHLSLQSISAAAMTAAVSLGSTFDALGTSASTVVAGGAQSLAQGANTVAATLPTTVQAGAASTAHLAADLGVIKDPALAMSRAVPRATPLVRVAGFLGKALPVLTIGTSALVGARIVADEGPGALVTSKQGRGAALGAVGGTLLLIPTPATQLAAAGVLGAVAANQFGGLDGLDHARPHLPGH